MPVGRKHNKYGVPLDKPCARCNTRHNLTRHHIKNKAGRRTGKIIILCRECHDLAEERYEEEGIAGKNNPVYMEWLKVKGGDRDILSINNVTHDSLIPFHARG